MPKNKKEEFSSVDPDLLSDFVENLEKAHRSFGAEISLEVLAQATLEGISPPDRVGGHDESRGKTGGAQKKKNKSASDHGVNQGKQYLQFKNTVLKRRLSTLEDPAVLKNGDTDAKTLVKAYKNKQKGRHL